MSNDHTTIHISTSSILKIIAIILILWLLYAIRAVLVILFIAIIIAAAFDPIVDFLKKRKMPRILSTSLIFLALLGLLGLIISLIIPPLALEIRDLALRIPDYYNKIILPFVRSQKIFPSSGIVANIQKILQTFSGELSKVTGNVFSATIRIFGGLISTIIIFVLSFYLLVREQGTKKLFQDILPEKYKNYAMDLLDKTSRKMAEWVWARFALCIIMGVLIFIGLKILGVKYALMLGLVAGILDIIPIVGPIIAAILAIFISLTQSFYLSIAVLVLYIVISQIEGYILIPKMFKKASELNPVLIILALLIGAKLGGIVGLIIAVPVATVVFVFFKNLPSYKRSITK